MHILLGAFYISAYEGSESGLGWRVATELAKHHKVTVICGDLGRKGWRQRDTRRALEEGIIPPNLHIEVVGPNFATWLFRKIHALPGLWFFYYVGYKFWVRRAYQRAKELHRESPFDIVHQINIISYRVPGQLWKLGVPYFWGPVAGAVMVPPAFLADFSGSERLRWGLRNLVNRFQRRSSPAVELAARAACKVWTVSSDDAEVLSKYGANVEAMIETGAELSNSARIRKRCDNTPLVLCWSGLFCGIKALPLLLRALAGLKNHDWILHVIGDGPEKANWMKELHFLNLGDRIVFHGQVTRVQALEIMDMADVLVHSSVKEGTPHVVLEALSSGMPVICHDACGMGIAVNSTCGIKVPLVCPDTSSDGFRTAILRLLQDPYLLHDLSCGAIERARELSWESKVQHYLKAYQAAC